MVHQLRIYEIFEHNKAAFQARFRDHAARLMRGYGFTIAAMWESRGEERTEFVYLLAWPDEATMRQAWAAFLADAEWVEIKRVTREQHGDLVGAISDRVLHPLGDTSGLAASSPAPEASNR
jgi:heme-degrading monooxygenase HmoA